MKKMMALVLLLMLGLTILPLAGCGGGDGGEQQEQKSEVAATHDCAGGCGMTGVPEDQLTLVDGKYYCAGCVDKAKGGDHSHDGHDHDGHDH